MNEKELSGRVIALEALVKQLIIQMPPADAHKITGAAMPGLTRHSADVAPFTTLLVADINRAIPRL